MQITSDAGRRMFLQIFTHARSVNRNWNATFRKMRAWPDAALHEDYRACSAPAETMTWRALIDTHSLSRIRRPPSIRPSTMVSPSNSVLVRMVRFGRRRTSGDRYARAGPARLAVLIQIDRGREYAVHPRAVLVIQLCIAHVGENLRDGACKPTPADTAMALYRHGPFPPVEWLTEVGVSFQLLEVGQNIGPFHPAAPFAAHSS